MEIVNHECYVSLEVAKLLKEAGFDWGCKTYYDTSIYLDETIIENELRDYNFMNGSIRFSAPTLDVAQRWLREVKGIHMCVKADEASIKCKYFVTVIISDTKWGNVQDENKKTILFNTYEEAQEAGIKKALEIIKGKNNETRITIY